MKRILDIILLSLAGWLGASCSLFDNQGTPKGYVGHCVRLLDRQALYADKPEWRTKRTEILSAAKAISTMDEAHSLVEEAAAVAGGKHSFLMAPVKDTASYPEVAPETKILEGNILYVNLPNHSGVKVSDSLYLHTVLDFLQEHLDGKGVIVDLRDNPGGNMYPMIAAVSPLLPDGVILKFKSCKRTTPITLEYVVQSNGLAPSKIQKFPEDTPVALLTGDNTASSGEATLLCFRGLDNVKTFGGPSAGYASANVSHILADGYLFAITRSCDEARTGEVFCDDPIVPDVETDTPLEDATAWITSGNASSRPSGHSR